MNIIVDKNMVEPIRQVLSLHLGRKINGSNLRAFDITSSDDDTYAVIGLIMDGGSTQRVSEWLYKEVFKTPRDEHCIDGGLVGNVPLSGQNKLVLPPGSKLLQWSRFIFPKKFLEGDITETIHDMQREYIESISKGNEWHAKYVCFRGYMSYGVCVFCGLVGGVGKKIIDAWKGVSPS